MKARYTNARMKIAFCQLNQVVGDVSGNTRKIISFVEQAKKGGAQVVLFPELAVTGYPPEDLVLNPRFIQDNINAVGVIEPACADIVAVVGFVHKENGSLFNAAAIIQNKKLRHVLCKVHLPNYSVFDEKRYFAAGSKSAVCEVNGMRFGINICEDMWIEGFPISAQAESGASVIFNISASPYYQFKPKEREEIFRRRAVAYKVFVGLCNQVGGQDDLVFDGSSCLISPNGETIARSSLFNEEILFAEITPETSPLKPVSNIDLVKLDTLICPQNKIFNFVTPFQGEDEELFNALVLATRDYCWKNNFKKTIIGLSGGIDSSIVACIAYEALGKDVVLGVSMPSMFSSEGSVDDAILLAKNLGIKITKVPIKKIYDQYLEELKTEFAGREFDVAEENIQARIRGNILMALSNKFGYLVLTTGNKSEISMGYSTLYGDMAGGFAVIKDVYKTAVYKLSKYYNKKMGREIIPKSVLEKPPSAELRPNQKDQDTLPPYEILDEILKCYVENDMFIDEIVTKTKADSDLVKRVVSTVDRNEYKRRQSAPGPKVTRRAFGKDRRFPITLGKQK